jgi:hypothetical protein
MEMEERTLQITTIPNWCRVSPDESRAVGMDVYHPPEPAPEYAPLPVSSREA